jgi:hypothetical protein
MGNVDILDALKPLEAALEAARHRRQGDPVKAEHSRETRAQRSCLRCGGVAPASASVDIRFVSGGRLVPRRWLVCETCRYYISIYMTRRCWNGPGPAASTWAGS